MAIVTVNASKSYDVVISPDILKNTGDILKDKFGVKTNCIITDETVDSMYSPVVVESLEKSGHKVVKYVFPVGENSKGAENFVNILNFLASNKLTRSDIIIALGGGIPGDVAGFAAATYLRGVKFVQIPTTLLACVDSSVGGKTAINLDEGKNLAGAFYQPDLVLCDYSTLETLPDHVFSDGVAEVVKYGVIKDEHLFNLAEMNLLKDKMEEVIERCVSIKRDIVNEDERDMGVRQLLNYGHTYGHAIEKASNYTLSHGSAVAIGMCMVSKAAYKLGFSDEDITDRLVETLRLYNLPTQCPYDVETLINAALSDKKRQGEKINLVLPKRIGECFLQTIDVKDLEKYFEAGM